MKVPSRVRTQRLIAALVVLPLALGGSLVASSSASAYGPSVMYTGAETNPNYSRAIQLHHNGVHNGTMLATFDHAVLTMPDFTVFESTDSGENWGQVGTVSDTENGWGLRYQPHLIELPQSVGDMPEGTILVAGNSIPSDGSATKIDIYKSNDIGRTWTFVSSVSTGGDANPDSQHDPIWEPFMVVANNKLIVYYSDERDPAHNQKLVHQTSVDGVNWNEVVEDVALPTQYLRPGMSTVAQMADGNWIMTYEVMPLDGDPVHYQISSDPEVWNTANQGTFIAKGGAPYVVTMPNGKIAVSILEHEGVFVNSTNGTGPWTPIESPLTDGYSRSLTVLDNGRLFLTTGSGGDIVYADMDAGGTVAKFINRATSKALDNGGSTIPGTDVGQWDNGDSDNLRWNVERGPDGYLKLRSITGGDQYLDTLNRSSNGQNVGQNTGDSSYNQQWKVEHTGFYQRLLSRDNGLAVDTGGLNQNGAPMQMWEPSASINQQWTMIPEN